MEDVTHYFLEATKNCDELKEAEEIVKNNSKGNIWLIGGFIYRNIVSEMYGTPRPEVDLDFIVEIPVENFNLPDGWTVQRNRFGNPKFVNGTKMIDYVPMNNIYSIQYNCVLPTIENYLKGTPLTIQSVVFDIYKQEIIFGDKFLDALQNKKIEITDKHFAEYYSKQKEKPLEELMEKMAKDLDFKVVKP